MTSAGPWWGSAVLAFGGVLLTLSATLWIDYWRGRRETTFRWTERKLALYTSYVKLASDLRDVPVWPDLGDEKSLLDRLRVTRIEIEFIAPAAVSTAAGVIAANLDKLIEKVREIRNDSRPGHQNTVVNRFNDEYLKAVGEVSAAIRDFIEHARLDADIRSKFGRRPPPPTDPRPR